LAEEGVPYRDIAVLVRSRAAYPRLIEQFATFGIPVQPGGRSGLFDQPEAVVLGRTVAWLSDIEWRDRYGPGRAISDEALLSEYQRVFELPNGARNRLARFLREWKAVVPRTDRPANLMAEFYELLDDLAVRSWDLSDALRVNRLGTLARFSSLLVDYESVRAVPGPIPTRLASSLGGRTAGSGTTATSPSTSSTTPRGPTRASTVKPTSS
jgi:DNA helicase II / ATP-dependent DNA helicase PcrA